MTLTEDGIDTDERELHLEKHLLPNTLTDDGVVDGMVSRRLNSSPGSSTPIETTDDGMETSSIETHSMKLASQSTLKEDGMDSDDRK